VKNLTKLLLILIVGSFLFQSFQCATPEMSSGKNAMNIKEWDKAIDMFKKEVKSHPENGEAWVLIADAYYRKAEDPAEKDFQKKLEYYKEAIAALKEADGLKLTPKLIQSKETIKFNTWVNTTNAGTTLMDKALKDEKNKVNMLTQSIEILKFSNSLRPNKESNKKYLAIAYDRLGKEDKANEYNLLYAKDMEKSLNFGKEKGLFLKKLRLDALKEIGEPKTTEGNRMGEDSIITDGYLINDKLFFLFSRNIGGEEGMRVVGWRYDPPISWLPPEKDMFTQIDVTPFSNMAFYYSQKEDNEKAINALLKIVQLDPTNKNANTFLVSMLNETGRSNEANEMLKDLINKSPDVPEFRLQYGDLLFNQKKYDEAIEQYSAALKIDPNFADANRNMASAYKNKAVEVQKIQKDKQMADPKYVANPEEYFPFLEESIKNFEACLKNDNYKRDFRVYVDLWNSYYAMDKQDKAKETLIKLENLEGFIDEKDKMYFWGQLASIYGMLKNDTKYEKAQKCLKNIRNNLIKE
jgi:tetratricopeptide (TPR) repeat protein